jgi:hypothetical protein
MDDSIRSDRTVSYLLNRVLEAVKNGSGKVDGRFDVTVDAGNNGFNVTIKDTQTGETYKDGATVEAGENAEAFAERYTAAISATSRAEGPRARAEARRGSTSRRAGIASPAFC